MAYGATYWMRDCWDSDLLRQAWNNYGTRRTDNQWRDLYNQCLLAEQNPEETSDDGSVWEEVGGTEVVMRRRIFIDLTQGDEPVITEVSEPVTPPATPVFVPYTLDSPEMLEDYTVVRNSCA